MSQYPEHEKLKKIASQSQVIGEFVEWLQGTQHIALCMLDEFDRFYPTRRPIQEYLAKYFNINTEKLEREKKQMIEECRMRAPQLSLLKEYE